MNIWIKHLNRQECIAVLQSLWFNSVFIFFMVWKNLLQLLTPSNEYESPEIFGIRAKSHEDEAMQVEAFHQDPVVVGCQKVDEEQHCHFAANLETEHSGLSLLISAYCHVAKFAFGATHKSHYLTRLQTHKKLKHRSLPWASKVSDFWLWNLTGFAYQ